MDQHSTTDFNFNAAQCIKSADHFGYTEYLNICNGTHQALTWGAWDWIWTILGTCFVTGFVIFIVLGITWLLRNL